MSYFLPAGVCNNSEVLSRLWLLWIKCYFDLLNSNLNVLVSKCACHLSFLCGVSHEVDQMHSHSDISASPK